MPAKIELTEHQKQVISIKAGDVPISDIRKELNLTYFLVYQYCKQKKLPIKKEKEKPVLAESEFFKPDPNWFFTCRKY